MKIYYYGPPTDEDLLLQTTRYTLKDPKTLKTLNPKDPKAQKTLSPKDPKP